MPLMGIQYDFVGLYMPALVGKHQAQIPAPKSISRLVPKAGACYLYVNWPDYLMVGAGNKVV